MIDLPVWLPEMLELDGAWAEVILPQLYYIFESDFKNTRQRFQGLPVWWDRTCLDGECYEEGFWHLIAREDKKEKRKDWKRETKEDKERPPRFPDFRRAERLPWCGPTITNSHQGAVCVWNYREDKGRVRTYVWLHELDYVVILERKRKRLGEIAWLVTAFHVDGDSTRRSLRKKYEKREP
jgi:hypothetical protein